MAIKYMAFDTVIHLKHCRLFEIQNAEDHMYLPWHLLLNMYATMWSKL